MSNSVKIVPIPMLPWGMLNAFLLISGRDAILIDTGLPNSNRLLEKSLQRHGLDWSNIKLIILTHGHIDHAGSAVSLRKLTNAPIVAHEGDLSYFRGGLPTFKTTGLFSKVFKSTGLIQKPYAYFTPDVILTEELTIFEDTAISLRVLHTPGHTPGSISILFDDGKVLAGDLLSSGILLGGIAFKGLPKQPPFEEDSSLVARSLELLLEQNCTKFYLGHGGPLSADKIRKHIAFLKTD
jgi:hydroxyacylglutathione hydrolase